MSDYISKSALVEVLEKSMKENSHKSMIGYAEHIQEHRHLIHLVEKQPTLDEKEIIRKVFERVVEILKQRNFEHFELHQKFNDECSEIIRIVKKVGDINE